MLLSLLLLLLFSSPSFPARRQEERRRGPASARKDALPGRGPAARERQQGSRGEQGRGGASSSVAVAVAAVALSSATGLPQRRRGSPQKIRELRRAAAVAGSAPGRPSSPGRFVHDCCRQRRRRRRHCPPPVEEHPGQRIDEAVPAGRLVDVPGGVGVRREAVEGAGERGGISLFCFVLSARRGEQEQVRVFPCASTSFSSVSSSSPSPRSPCRSPPPSCPRRTRAPGSRRRRRSLAKNAAGGFCCSENSRKRSTLPPPPFSRARPPRRPRRATPARPRTRWSARESSQRLLRRRRRGRETGSPAAARRGEHGRRRRRCQRDRSAPTVDLLSLSGASQAAPPGLSSPSSFISRRPVLPPRRVTWQGGKRDRPQFFVCEEDKGAQKSTFFAVTQSQVFQDSSIRSSLPCSLPRSPGPEISQPSRIIAADYGIRSPCGAQLAKRRGR